MTWEIREGDCRLVVPQIEPGTIDAIVTDPPYDLAFMGKKWDSTGVAFDPETWRIMLDAAKPGAHPLLGDAGTAIAAAALLTGDGNGDDESARARSDAGAVGTPRGEHRDLCAYHCG